MKTLVYIDGDKKLQYINAELIKSDKDKQVYNIPSHDFYKAANIQKNTIKLLTKTDYEHKGKLLNSYDGDLHKLKLIGDKHYATETAVRAINKEINVEIKFPQYTSNANIMVNECVLSFDASGYSPTEWHIDIIDVGKVEFIEQHGKTAILGFKEPITQLQQVINYID